MSLTPTLQLQQYEFENPVTVLRNAVDLLGVKVTDAEISKVHFHPDYPALSSLTSSLNNWGIETFAAQINISQLAEITYPAIAHSNKYGGQFLLLTSLSGDQITYHDSETGWITESLEKFSHSWTGIILLMEPAENAGDTNFEENLKNEKLKKASKNGLIFLTSLFVLAVLSYSYWLGAASYTVTGIVFLVGLMVSGLIVSSELDSTFTKSFCMTGKNMDCQSILNSRAATLFGWLKMSDVGMIWFSAFWLSWIFGLLTNNTATVLAGLSALSLCAVVYVPFSIGYQWLIARKWCSLCLVIQSILVINAILLIPFLKNSGELFSGIQPLFCLTIGFTLASAGWLFIKPLLLNSKRLGAQEKDLYAFKFDTELFRSIWEKQIPIKVIEYDQEIRVGSPDAPLQLVLVTNPLCESCATAHKKLEKLYDRMKDKISIVMRFSVSPDDGSAKVIQHLYSLPAEKLEEALRNWFHEPDYKIWSRLYPIEISSKAEKIVNEHQLWCNWVRVDHTPTIFLNSRKIPSQFKIEDLSYHLVNFNTEKIAGDAVEYIGS